MSETLGSFSRGSSGPRPKISSRISRDRRSRSAKLRGTASLFTELRIKTRTSSRAVSLFVRPNFSRSSRSRIFRWRSAFTCWYSVRSKVCKFGMFSLDCLEHRPGAALHVVVVLCERRSQATERLCNLGVVLIHQGDSAIDRTRYGKVLVGNPPQQTRPGSGLGVTFVKPRNLAKAVQHQLDPFLAVVFPQELHDARGAPQRRNVGMSHQQDFFRQIADQAGGAIHT